MPSKSSKQRLVDVLDEEEFTPTQESLADLNGDGGVNVLDIVQLVNLILQ